MFKLVCGAGNEDAESVKRLVYVYALAGCRFFDLCADKKVITSARRVLEKLGNLSSSYLCASFGIKGDPHTFKALVNEKCYEAWLIKVEEVSEVEDLLDAEAYANFCEQE